MKKKSTLLLVSALVFLSGCQKTSQESISGSETASETVSETPSGSVTSQDQPRPAEKLTRTKASELLKAMAKADSFDIVNTQTTVSGSHTFVDTYTKNYIYRSSSLKPDGYVLRASAQDMSRTTAYGYVMSQGAVQLENQASDEDGGFYTSLDAFNPAKGLMAVTADSFVMDSDGGVYLSETGYDILYAMGHLLNYGLETEDDSFSQVLFSLDADGDLVFSLMVTTDDGTLEAYDTASVKHVNAARNDTMEAYLKTAASYLYAPQELLTDIAREHDYAAEIDEVMLDTSGEGYENPIADITINSGDRYYQIELPSSMEGMDKVTLLEKQDGKANAFKVYLDGTNNIAHADTGKTWESMAYRLSDYVDGKDLVAIDSETYRYFGSRSAKIYKAISYLTGDYGYRTIDFKVSGDTLTDIIVRSNNYFGSLNSLSYQQAKVSVRDFTTPTLPTPIAEDGNTAHIATLFANFNGEKSFTATIRDEDASDSVYREIAYTENAVVITDHSTKIDTSVEDGVAETKRISGHYKTSEGWVPFVLNDDGICRATGTPDSKMTLASLIGFDASPALFKEDPNTRTLTLKQEISDIGNHIIGDSHKNDIPGRMLTMTYSKTDRNLLESLRYRYSYNHDQLRGYQKVEFTDYEQTAIDSDLQKKLDGMKAFEEPKSWIVEDGVYQGLVSLFGEEVAKKIPYLYDSRLFGLWVSAEINHTSEAMNRQLFVRVYDGDNVLNWSLSEDPINYMGRFAEMLEADTAHVYHFTDGDGKAMYYLCDDASDIRTAYAAIKIYGEGPQEGFIFCLPQ